jgi:hypothetical protein
VRFLARLFGRSVNPDPSHTDLQRLIESYEPLSTEAMKSALRRRGVGNAVPEAKWLYMETVDPLPWQGDVIPHAELHLTNKHGESVSIVGPAMLLSHGCDTVPAQKPVAVMAPVFDLLDYEKELRREGKSRSEITDRMQNVQRNLLVSTFYLPALGNLPRRYVDFGFAMSISTERVQELFKAADLAHRSRLSREGWYLFTAKLAHHFARQENPADYPRRL